MKRIALFILSLCSILSSYSNDRLSWFKEAKIGAFFHYGVYSSLEGKYIGTNIHEETYTEDNPFVCEWGAEWILNQAKIPRSIYKTYSSKFTASELDMDEWMKVAKKFGARYVVLTAKHHEGFLMYPSTLSDWCTTNSAANGRDIVGEFVEAANKHGFRIGIYFSQNVDWVNEGGLGKVPELKDGEYSYLEQKKYIDETSKVLSEIMDRYGDSVDLFWWDIPSASKNKEFSDILMNTLKEHPKYRDEIIHNDRMSYYEGDYVTLEESFSHAPTSYFERCKSVTFSWGYSSKMKVFSKLEILNDLVRTLNFGGNSLINLPPKENGKFQEDLYEVSEEISDYIIKNKEGIYNTEYTGIIMNQDFGRVTRSGNTLYLHYWHPKEKIELVGYNGNILSSSVLGGGSVDYKKTPSGYLFDTVNKYDVIKVEFDNIETIEGKTGTLEEDITLKAFAAISSNYLFFDHSMNDTRTGPCCRLKSTVKWFVNSDKTAKYKLFIRSGAYHDGNLSLKVNGKESNYTIKKTTGDFNFVESEVCEIELNSGENTIELREIGSQLNIMFHDLRLEQIEVPAGIESSNKDKVKHYTENGLLYINNSEPFHYIIINQSGVIIQQGFSHSKETSIDLSGFENELMLVKIVNNNSHTHNILKTVIK